MKSAHSTKPAASDNPPAALSKPSAKTTEMLAPAFAAPGNCNTTSSRRNFLWKLAGGLAVAVAGVAGLSGKAFAASFAASEKKLTPAEARKAAKAAAEAEKAAKAAAKALGKQGTPFAKVEKTLLEEGRFTLAKLDRSQGFIIQEYPAAQSQSTPQNTRTFSRRTSKTPRSPFAQTRSTKGIKVHYVHSVADLKARKLSVSETELYPIERVVLIVDRETRSVKFKGEPKEMVFSKKLVDAVAKLLEEVG
jgi:hypothetical protein